MSLTTVLQIFKRPHLLREQFNAIKNQTIDSDEIFIVHNASDSVFDISSYTGIKYFFADPNQKFHFRFAIALLAKTEYIAFFDDDTIPGPLWYQNCIDTINRHDCLCVSSGRIFNKSTKSCYDIGWMSKNEDDVRVDFGGHAWFLKAEYLKYMWYGNILEQNNGEDIQLSANLSIYGNIPTYVPPHPNNEPDRWGSGSNAIKYGMDNVASYLNNQLHTIQRVKLIDKYIQNGWKLQNA